MLLADSLHRKASPDRALPFSRQLWLACDCARARSRGHTEIVLLCIVDTPIPQAHAPVLLQAADTLVAHAIQFGMTMHLIGCVAARIGCRDGHLMLEVEDDGLAHGRQPDEHLGIAAVRRLAERAGGRLELERCWAFNTVRLFLPALPPAAPINAAGAKVAQSAANALI